jgi:hypothetical protein
MIRPVRPGVGDGREGGAGGGAATGAIAAVGTGAAKATGEATGGSAGSGAPSEGGAGLRGERSGVGSSSAASGSGSSGRGCWRASCHWFQASRRNPADMRWAATEASRSRSPIGRQSSPITGFPTTDRLPSTDTSASRTLVASGNEPVASRGSCPVGPGGAPILGRRRSPVRLAKVGTAPRPVAERASTRTPRSGARPD